ncbi:hypothetical protein SteCoe_26102 [Stentor coeruleus]|uniref:Uncharacterized protein n=1 Tax=Stentor coeruleus TaxID=5963 RepID=A0A1R2BE54_9CILI|nr:hypothetical protein SteCoe_26102 [Stentor coeruleus]
MKHLFLQLNQESFLLVYNNIRHDDIFVINFYCFCLEKNDTLMLDRNHKIKNYLNKELIQYLKNFFVNFKNFENLRPEKKAYLKSFILSVINGSVDLDFIEYIIDEDFTPLSDRDIKIFKTIINTRVCKQAFQIFIEDTLKLGNGPFKTVEEGINMLNYTFDHVARNSTIFFAVLPNLRHAFSTCEFIFISNAYYYKKKCAMNDTIKLLCLLHEVSHIYKRIYPGQSIANKSPSSQIWVQGNLKEGLEDGYRFESILLPQPFIRLYITSAKYLMNIDSWNTDLDNFKNNLTNISSDAQIDGNTPYVLFRDHGYVLGDYCYNLMQALGRNH